MRARISLACVLTFAVSAADAAEPAKLELNKSGVKAVVAWGGHSAEIAFAGPGKPAQGVFDGAVQFQLDPAQVAALQNACDVAGVGGMPRKIGGIPGRSGRLRPNDPPPLVGWVTVRDPDGVVANVNQLGGGHQSAELARFANDLLATCNSAARVGRKGNNLTDGLVKIRDGSLSGSALTIDYTSAHLFDSGDFTGVGLQVQAGVAVARRWEGNRWGDARRLTLSEGDLKKLAKSLADSNLAHSPGLTGAARPTAISVRVLAFEKSVFATPDTYDEEVNQLVARIQLKRAGFAETVEDPSACFRAANDVLSQLAERVLAEGIE